ncbi:unnamed protein product [Arctogadus glacialis]
MLLEDMEKEMEGEMEEDLEMEDVMEELDEELLKVEDIIVKLMGNASPVKLRTREIYSIAPDVMDFIEREHVRRLVLKTAAPLSRLKSRHPYNKAAQELLRSTTEDLSKDGWLAAAWKQEWERAGPTQIHHYILDPGDGATGDDLPRRQWTLLNRLRTGVDHPRKPASLTWDQRQGHGYKTLSWTSDVTRKKKAEKSGGHGTTNTM